MKINVKTLIKTDRPLIEVFHEFNEAMFLYLTENAPVKPLRYDGDEVGSEVHLQMLFPWKDKWVSVITERSEAEHECYFIDKGITLPFNILEWEHRHIVQQSEEGIIIEDAITFESTNFLFNVFWWLAFMPQFLLRKVQYRRYLKST